MALAPGDALSRHEAQAASAGAPSLFRQHFLDAVGFEKLLNRRFAQSGNLPALSRSQRSGVHWKALLLRGVRDNESDAQAALFEKFWVASAQILERRSYCTHTFEIGFRSRLSSLRRAILEPKSARLRTRISRRG